LRAARAWSSTDDMKRIIGSFMSGLRRAATSASFVPRTSSVARARGLLPSSSFRTSASSRPRSSARPESIEVIRSISSCG
jgi:hypothetical protein